MGLTNRSPIFSDTANVGAKMKDCCLPPEQRPSLAPKILDQCAFAGTVGSHDGHHQAGRIAPPPDRPFQLRVPVAYSVPTMPLGRSTQQLVAPEIQVGLDRRPIG